MVETHGGRSEQTMIFIIFDNFLVLEESSTPADSIKENECFNAHIKDYL